MKAKSKTVGIIGIVIAIVLIAAIIVIDVLCATYSALITLAFRGEAQSPDAQAALTAANEFTVTQEASGLVMMKNENNVLPLAASTKKVNLFGALSAKQIYMGTGSAGGFNWSPEDFVNLKTAFGEKGIEVNTDLWDFYSDLTGNASGVAGSVTDMQGSTHSIIDVSLDHQGYAEARTAAESYSDTAIIVVGRAGGEGSDAVMEMNPYSAEGRGGTTDYNVGGDAGKHYLELMDVELDMVDYVKANYKNVILLVNSPMPIELGFVDGEQNADGKGNIDSVIWMGLPGSTGNRGVVQVLTGEVSPSGRLPDTWAYEMESAPSYYNFGAYAYDFGDTAVPEGYTATNYVHYKESIYVGYRWYETANAEGVVVNDVGNFQYNNTTYENEDRKFGRDGQGNVIGAEQKDFDFGDYDSIVQYAFGTGKSYADFDISFASEPTYDSATNEFVFNVKVKNTSTTVTSKTPVEIYVEQPWIQSEGIEKAKVVLANFDKTDDIAPGGEATVEIRINRDEIASYDYETEKAYVLSAGDYKFYVDWGEYGSHCWANTTDTSDVLTWTYNLPSKIVFKGDEKRDSDVTAATNKFDDVNIGDGAYTPSEDDMQRGRLAETFPESYSAGLSENVVNEQTKARMFDKTYGAVLEGYDAANYKYTGEFAEADGSYKDPSSGYNPLPTGQAGDLTVADLVGVPYDDERWDSLISQMSFADLETLVGYCGWSNPAIRSIGKNFAVDMDGCHGLHDLTTGVDANCYTTTPITAATFDRDVAYTFGTKYSAECLANGVTGMYGFSMNMHRSPFGGRAFEYYSEDGLLAGMMATAVSSGMQDNGVALYSKHYAINDQETNRSTCHSWASEQAMRELYLRPFELVTKNATVAGSEVLSGNTGFMTGMNFVGTSHTTSHYSLVTAVPRGEWGFEGRIVTDAESFNNTMSCAMRAGTDMILTPRARTFDTIEGMDNSKGYGLVKIQEAAKHQLFVFVNTAGVGVDSGLSYAWVALPVVISVVLAAGAVLVFIFMVYPAFFKKKEA